MFRFLVRMGRLLVGIALAVAITIIIGTSTLGTAPVAVASIIGVSPLSAAPVAARSGGGGGTSSASSLSLVLLNSTDGLPHWGQDVTFNVSTTATNEPYVSLNCYQNGVLVYGASAGFFPSYPWPGSRIFPLSSPSWTSGAADCAAKLYYVNGKKTNTLATLDFHVYA